VLKIGSSADALIDISQFVHSFGFNRHDEAREIPGGGSVQRQLLGNVDYSLNFTVVANDITRPLLHMKDELYIEWAPRGTAAGNPKYTGKFFITVDDREPMFIVSGVTADGAPEGTY